MPQGETKLKTVHGKMDRICRDESFFRYQQKLQQNLMYLAAIADAQPQPLPASVRAPLIKFSHWIGIGCDIEDADGFWIEYLVDCLQRACDGSKNV